MEEQPPMKTKLTTGEKFLTVAGITIAGTLISSSIGKQIIPQTILTALILYLLTGRRPTIIYATLGTWRRDIL